MTIGAAWLDVDATLAVLRALEGVHDEDEGVDALAHALQTADLAVEAGGDDELVAAALLHDIGRAPEVVERYGRVPHERSGADFSAAHATERMAYLVAQHVPAKRYLVAVDDRYAAGLSPASVRSLARQGGPMDDAEVVAFEAHPWAADAARLRRFDDEAKVPDAPTRPLEHFAGVLRAVWDPSPDPGSPVTVR